MKKVSIKAKGLYVLLPAALLIFVVAFTFMPGKNSAQPPANAAVSGGIYPGSGYSGQYGYTISGLEQYVSLFSIGTHFYMTFDKIGTQIRSETELGGYGSGEQGTIRAVSIIELKDEMPSLFGSVRFQITASMFQHGNEWQKSDQIRMNVESSNSVYGNHNEKDGSNWPLKLAREQTNSSNSWEVWHEGNISGKYLRISIEIWGWKEVNMKVHNFRLIFNPTPISLWKQGGKADWGTLTRAGTASLATGCSTYNDPSGAYWISGATAAGNGDCRYNENYNFNDGITRNQNGTPDNELIMDQGGNGQNRKLMHLLTIPLSADIQSEIAAGRITMTFTTYLGNRQLDDATSWIFIAWGSGSKNLEGFYTSKVAFSSRTNGKGAYWHYMSASLSGAVSGVTHVRVGLMQVRGSNSSVHSELYGKEMALKITPSISVKANNVSKIYGDSDPGLTYTITAGKLLGGDSLSGSLTRASGNTVGSYTISQGGLTNPNYNISFSNGTFTINPRPITVAANHSQGKVYGDSDPVLTYTISAGNLVGSDSLSGALARQAGEAVGTYPINRGNLANSNYDINFLGSDFTITQRPITVIADPKEKVYGDPDPALTYRITGGNLVGSDTLSGAITRQEGETVGGYIIQKGSLGNGNYSITFVDSVLTITPRQISVAANAASKTYGDPDPAELTYRITSGNLVNGDSFSGALQRQPGEDARSYTINKHTLSLSENYTLNYISASFTITPRQIMVAADNKSKIYGQPDPGLTYSIVSGSLAFSDTFTGNVARVGGESVGFYTIHQNDLRLSSNYTLLFTNGAFTIERRPITIKGDTVSKIYGEADPAFTYSITAGSLVGSDKLSGTLARDAGDNAGTYNITQGTVNNTHNPNYDITYVNGQLTILTYEIAVTPSLFTKIYGEDDPELTEEIQTGINGETVTVVYTREEGENAGSYSLLTVDFAEPQQNYTVTFAEGSAEGKFAIGRRPITVTADSINRIFGEPLIYEYTYRITSGSLAFSDTLSGELACEAVQAAGRYPISQGTLTDENNPNYAITFVGAFYNISKASIGVSVPKNTYYKIFAEDDPQLTHETDGVGEKFFVTFTREPGEDAGFYDIVSVASQDPNYQVYIQGDSGKDSFEIRRRQITVFANPAGHIYGEADAIITFSVANLPSGYTVAGTLSREEGKDVNTYQILQGSVTDENNPNYAITFVGNTYTIYRRPITVTAIDTGHTYGDPEAPLYFDSGDIAEGDILQGTPEREAGDAYRPEGYAITQGSVTDANNPNYRITFVNGTYRIYKRSLAVYPEVYTKTYGDPDPAFAQVVDGIPGEQVEVTFSAGGVSRAGTYPLISVSADDTNYSVYIPEGAEADKYIINRRPITVTAIAAGHIFGDADAPLNYDAVNLVSGDVLIGALTREAGSFWREGGYAILQGSITNENNPDYDITYIGATYTVHKRPVIVRALPSGHTYGEEGSNLPYTAENAITTMPLKGSLAREEGVHWREEGYAILQGTLNNANNPDYDITYYGATYTIHKRPIEVRADSKSIVYGDVDVPLTYTAVNLVAGDTLIGSLIKEEGRDWREEGYAILQGSITDENNPDYLITYYGAVYTIRKCNIAVTPSLFTKGYGEDDPELIQTANGVSGETFTVTFTRSNPETQSAGEYDISAIISVSDNNYTATIAAGAGLRKFVILRKDVTVTARDAFHIYGDTDAPLEFGFTELAYGETSLNGSLAREEGNTYREGGYRILQGTVDNLRNPNYNITFIEGVYTIKKRPVTIQAKDKTQPYGAAETPLEYEITEGSLIGGDTFTGAIIREPGIVVGEYAIRQGSLNNINYEITFIPAVYTIVKARITVTAEPKSITYGDEDVPLTYTLTPGLFYNDTLSGALTRQAGDAANEEGYDIYLGTLGNPNYEIEFIPAKYIIYRKRITVTANEKRQVYGDPGQPLTYLTEGILKGELIGALAREEGNNYRAEGYAITQGTLTDENNPNYRITFVGARYYIDKRPITVTADNQTQIYGDEAKPLTYTITSGSLAEGDSLAGELERERGNLVRSYTILGGSLTDPTLNPNYIIRFNIGTYTIAPRPVTVKADDKSIVYGDNDVPLTYQITEGSLIGQDILQGALIRDSGRAAGVYAIRAGTLHNSNYAISFVQGSYTIERRPVTVEAIPLTFTYGDTPDFGYTVIGLLEGDSLTGTPGIPGPNAGVYNITQGTLTNANNPDYDIQFVSAVCVVGRRPITVTLKPQSSEYGAPVIINSKAYTVTSGSLVAGDDPGVTIERVSQSLMIGYYGLTASYTNQNYEVTFIASYYEIKKIKPVITVAHDYIEMAYTGKPYHIAAAANTHAAIQYRINGQAVENSFAEAGTYRVTLTAGETDIHYSPDPVTVTIVIKPTAITGENIIVYRQQGFGDASGLKIALTEREGEYAQYLTRTETLSDSYSIDFGGEAMATIIKVKVPDALMGKGSVKLLITEGEVTRVLNLSPDANGFVSFEISSSATVSFVAPMQSRSTLTTVIGVAVAIAAIICVFLIVKGSASRRR